MKPAKKTEKNAKKTGTKSVAPAPVLVATKQRAVKPSSVAEVAATNKAPAAHKPLVTTIEAKIDVGFGNNLFVRGQGAGLSWEQGTPLVCVDGQTWRWTVPATDKLTFKLLLNDAIWSQGEDIVADPGGEIKLTPRF